MPFPIEDSWKSSQSLKSEGEVFGSMREFAKVHLWSRGFDVSERQKWDRLIASASFSPLEFDKVAATISRRIARGRALIEERNSLDDDELLVIISIAMELALVTSAINLLGGGKVPDQYADFRNEFDRISAELPLRIRFDSIKRQASDNSRIDLTKLLSGASRDAQRT
jgi:hypothetical protein